MVEKLLPDAISGSAVNMEAKFSQLTLDVIGLALFNYNFDSLTTDSPVIDAVYTALKEAELRSTDLLPYWQAGPSSTWMVFAELNLSDNLTEIIDVFCRSKLYVSSSHDK